MRRSGTNTKLATLDVSFGAAPALSFVTPLCQALTELCRRELRDDDAVARTRLVAHELLENIAKYSAPGPSRFYFELVLSGDEYVARVETENELNEARSADVEARLHALAGAGDPAKHYDAVIAASARKSEGSGLGLARIHAETEFRLSHRLASGRLVITAEARLVTTWDEDQTHGIAVR